MSKLGFFRPISLFGLVPASLENLADSDVWSTEGETIFHPFQPIFIYSNRCQMLLQCVKPLVMCSWMTKTDAQELCEEVFPQKNIGVYHIQDFLSTVYA